MTAKAIELLSQDADGFFLMVEGSQVDWAGHNNDPIYMITDALAFDEAFEVALDFARQDGNTMVVAFPDHNTGGMAIGHNLTAMDYTQTTVEDLVEPLGGMRLTSVGVATKIAEAGGYGPDEIPVAGDIVQGVSEWWGIDLTDAEAQEIIDLVDLAGLSLNYAIATVVSRAYTVFGWTTYGHTGEDVPIWSYGPRRIWGGIDNTEFATRVAAALGFDLDMLNQLLFVDVADYFPEYELDTTDPANPVVRVGVTSLPVSKGYLEVDGFESLQIPMPGLTVHAPMTGRCYVPLTAISLMQGFNSGAVAGSATQSASAAPVDDRLAELLEQLQVDDRYIRALERR
jgi:alkaline phosphatase